MSTRPLCSHWADGRCSLGLFGGSPSAGTCQACDRYEGPCRGLGDRVERVARATGVKAIVHQMLGGPCTGCARRRRELNREFPSSATTIQEQ